jgi:hypothetical protein
LRWGGRSGPQDGEMDHLRVRPTEGSAGNSRGGGTAVDGFNYKFGGAQLVTPTPLKGRRKAPFLRYGRFPPAAKSAITEKGK